MEEDDNAGVRDSHPRPVIHRDADLFRLAPWHLNDMVVDHDGRAWVGNFGFDLMVVRQAHTAVVICVEPDGTRQVTADGLGFPNGMCSPPTAV